MLLKRRIPIYISGCFMGYEGVVLVYVAYALSYEDAFKVTAIFVF